MSSSLHAYGSSACINPEVNSRVHNPEREYGIRLLAAVEITNCIEIATRDHGLCCPDAVTSVTVHTELPFLTFYWRLFPTSANL